MRVAIYVRASNKDDEMIKKQIKRCEVLAKRKNINVQGIYIDNGVSSSAEKPRLNKLLSKLNKFDCIITPSLHSFTRDTTEFIRIKKHLLENEVDVFYSDEYFKRAN